ncbi:MAG: DNA-directed RNA polymerase subunit omega [Rickettsiales bacterium]|jgi:DNA-directed RNA polymerase omega subunit|nr:DNA-directed RNA polymerase subunit omega [Rickettsiales bacterium]
MSDSVVVKPVSVEKCLDVVPNKFRLAIIVMNRARDLQTKAKPDVEVSKFARKSINKTLYEIRSGSLDIPSMEEKIKKDLLTNNLFPKSSKDSRGNGFNDNGDESSSGFRLKSNVSSGDSQEDREDVDGEETDDEIDSEEGDEEYSIGDSTEEMSIGGDL